MSGLVIKRRVSPDETRSFKDKGKVEIFQFEDATLGRMRMEPGWRWSKHVGPLTGTKTCEAAHLGYCLSGRMKIQMDDGEEGEIGPGDAFEIAPGHDAYVIGDDAFVAFDFVGMGSYATRSAPAERAGEGAAPPPIH